MVADVDFVLESPSTSTVLLVEAKSTSAPSTEWAGRFARTLFADTAPQSDLFFLLVLRNFLYLWKRVPGEGSELPDFSTPTEEALRPYLEKMQTPLKEILPLSFELLVKSWLTDLSEGSIPPSVEDWLRDAGLQQFENGLLREEQRN
ncbi:MAG TPA: hypothetical protein VE974_07890 [Thermoanaerobaculia bacterium]|nr:hypothetical protein [Thermoanaerobaculia bacterium]